jgi:RNA polymerase Rpb1, domain 6
MSLMSVAAVVACSRHWPHRQHCQPWWHVSRLVRSPRPPDASTQEPHLLRTLTVDAPCANAPCAPLRNEWRCSTLSAKRVLKEYRLSEEAFEWVVGEVSALHTNPLYTI